MTLKLDKFYYFHSFANNSHTSFDMILKSTISFKVIIQIALLTFFAPCFIPNASVDRGDGIGSFLWLFSNSFSRFVISLSLSLSITPLHHCPQHIHYSSCKLLKQYILIRLCHNLLLCCVKIPCFTFGTVHIKLFNLPLHTFYLNFRQFTCFQTIPNLAYQVLLIQLRQSIVLSVFMHSLSISDIRSLLCLQLT